MHQLGPFRAEQPQAAATSMTKMPFGTAGTAVRHLRVVHGDVFPSGDGQRRGVTTEVDGVTTPALGLAADRAIAALVRDRVGTFEFEANRAAMT